MVMGRPWLVVLIALASGICADLILKATNYKSVKACVFASGVFSIWIWVWLCPCSQLRLLHGRELCGLTHPAAAHPY